MDVNSVWTIKEWGILISLLFSFFSLLFVLYKDFLQGSKLKTVFSSLVYVKIGEGNKEEILMQVLLDDILSNHPSSEVLQIFEGQKNILDLLKTRNREIVKNEILRFFFERKQAGLPIIQYNPVSDSIEKYFESVYFQFPIYLPLNIINTGRKTGDVTTFILKITSQNPDKKVWIFSCFNEMKPDELIKFNIPNPTGNFVGKVLPGVSIPPNGSQRVDLFMIPIDKVNNTIISNSRFGVGTYEAVIIGYNSQNKKCLESNTVKIVIDKNLLHQIFSGNNIINNLGLEGHIGKELFGKN